MRTHVERTLLSAAFDFALKKEGVTIKARTANNKVNGGWQDCPRYR